MSKSKRKWCLPATCEMCKRTCTKFWGECADMWGCEGHYHIMETNSDTWGFKHYKEYQAVSKKLEGYPKPLSDEHKEELKASPEYKAWYEGPVFMKWNERRKQGVQWLKDNPEPDEVPVCKECGEMAKCQDEGEFFCLEHWPLDEGK